VAQGQRTGDLTLAQVGHCGAVPFEGAAPLAFDERT
jgi:hypothetical protein